MRQIGEKPTHELIQRLHSEHPERQAVIHDRFREVQQHLKTEQAAARDPHDPGTLASGNHQNSG